MAEQISPLDQVKLDAERLTRKRFEEMESSIAWQESQDRQVTHDEVPEVAVEEPEVTEEKPKVKKTVTKRKAK